MQTEVEKPAAGPQVAKKSLLSRRTPRPSRQDTVREVLMSLEEDGYQVLSNTKAGQDRIDHIVVGPTGVFVVMTNDWRGRFYLKRDGWFEHSRMDPGQVVWRANQHIVAVKRRLRDVGIKVPVRGVVALTRGKLREGAIDMGTVMFLHAPDTARYIRAGHRSLAPEQAARITDIIVRRGIPGRVSHRSANRPS